MIIQQQDAKHIRQVLHLRLHHQHPKVKQKAALKIQIGYQ